MLQRIDLKVGFRCNNRCDFCVQGDKRKSWPARPLAELEESLREGRRAGAEGLVVTGGEPTLHPELFALLASARRLGYRDIQLQTNGRALCYEAFCRRLAAAGVREFNVSLHGSHAALHDRLARAPGSFVRTAAGLRNLKRLGLRVIANSVVTSLNFRDLPALARLLAALGVDQFQLAYAHLLGQAGFNRQWLAARKSDVVPWIKAALDAGRAAGLPGRTEGIPFCLMRGYEECVSEPGIPATMIFDAQAVVRDYSRSRRAEGKAKGPRCSCCRLDSLCEGPWREYPELHGWDEFVPVP